MASSNTYSTPPKPVAAVDECYFYHTMEIPGHGLMRGDWDLRKGVGEYLGNVSFSGKRVLDVGTSSGYLSFHMERQGAEVVSFDLSPEQEPDVVPYAQLDSRVWLEGRREHLQQIDNAYWLAHTALKSRATKVYGNVYAIPAAIGPVDIAVFGSILLHLRDPFLALQGPLALTREAVIVTERLRRISSAPLLSKILPRSLRLSMRFMPDYTDCSHVDAWWSFTPEVIQQFLGVLGFEESVVSFHQQPFQGRPRRFFTVVGRRTQSLPIPSGA